MSALPPPPLPAKVPLCGPFRILENKCFICSFLAEKKLQKSFSYRNGHTSFSSLINGQLFNVFLREAAKKSFFFNVFKAFTPIELNGNKNFFFVLK